MNQMADDPMAVKIEWLVRPPINPRTMKIAEMSSSRSQVFGLIFNSTNKKLCYLWKFPKIWLFPGKCYNLSVIRPQFPKKFPNTTQ
jgi:hypothetical protein